MKKEYTQCVSVDIIEFFCDRRIEFQSRLAPPPERAGGEIIVLLSCSIELHFLRIYIDETVKETCP